MSLFGSTSSVLGWLYEQALAKSSMEIIEEEEEDYFAVDTDYNLSQSLVEDICATTLETKIAHLVLEIAKPSAMEVVKDVKVTFPDMLGTIGGFRDRNC